MAHVPYSHGLLVRNAGQIVTGQGPALRGPALRQVRVYENAWLYAENESIVAVGDPRSVESCVRGAPVELDADGKAVIPGFVDCHTHAVFAGSRIDEFVQRIAGATYSEIAAKGGGILSTVKATRQAGKADLKTLARARLQAALEQGTTTMEIKSGYGLDLDHELKMLDVVAELGKEQPVELVPTFLGAHAVPPERTLPEYLRALLDMLPTVAPKAKFCDVFCDVSYFPVRESRALLEKATACGLGLHLHAGQFAADGGVGLAVELGAKAVAHVDHFTEAELAALGQSRTAAVLLPGVSLFGATPWPAARRLIDAGAIVALASNFNPGSCPGLSMPLVVGLACMQMRMDPAEALNAATINAAYALGLEKVGSLEPGGQADLLILDVPDYRGVPYHFGVNPVRTVVKKGRVAWKK